MPRSAQPLPAPAETAICEPCPAIAPSALLAWSAVLILLFVCLGAFVVYAAAAIGFPYGLDYTEGEVWQQAKLIPSAAMYGDINHYPYIGFEYPPLYHLLTNALTHLGGSFLATGRAISVVATLASAAMVGLLVFQAAPPMRRAYQSLAAVIGGLLVLTMPPIADGAVLAHVDTLAMTLSLGGMVLTIQALRHPRVLYPAVLVCVAALLTKQNFIAAPAAAFVVMLVRNPRITLRSYLLGGVVGAAIAGFLTWQTGGGFPRHLFLYVINAFSLPHYLAFAVYVGWPRAIFIVLVGISVVQNWRTLARTRGITAPRALMQQIRADRRTALFALMTCYLATTAAFTLMAGKEGSSVNYFVEFMAVWCFWIGCLAGNHLARAPASMAGVPVLRRVALIWLAGAIILQIWLVPQNLLQTARAQCGPDARRTGAALLAGVRAVDGPILSDDLVLPLLAGKDVAIEPFLFAQLAANGMWDEARLTNLLNRHFFGAVVTFKDPGNIVFNGRFLPRTTAAILANYPRVEMFGDRRLRLER